MKLVHRIAGVLVVALLLAACDVKGPYHVPKTTEPYLRWEAPGMYGATTGARNIYWIDNDRVLYVGKDDDDLASERATLRIWTPSTGKVEILGPAKGEVCYFRGYVRYVESTRNAIYAAREGELGGSLASVPDYLARYKDLYSKGFRLHPINCRYFQSQDLAPGENCKLPLLPGDGYLEVSGGRCEAANQERIAKSSRREADDEVVRSELNRFRTELARRQVQYYPDNGQAVSLPIEANEFYSSGPMYEYLEWKRLYQFPQGRGKDQPTNLDAEWPADQDYVVYLFSTMGAVERVSIPVRKHFVTKPGRVAITKGGLVAMSPGFTNDLRLRFWGLILYSGGRPVVLDDGVTEEMALSADGCRVAYSRQTGEATQKDPVVKRVRVIDLCNRSR